VTQSPDQEQTRKALANEDLFLVVSELFVTDTAKYADIILPATMQAEQTDLMFSWGHFYWTYNNRAIDPPGETVPNTQLFRLLAETMGFSEPEWKRTDEEMIIDFVNWDDPTMKGITLEKLKENGYMRLDIGDKDTRVPHADGNFPTPSGKVELKSSLAAQGNFVPSAFRAGYEAFQDGGYVSPVPVYLEPWESTNSAPELATKYPLNILSPASHNFLNSQYANELKHQKRQGRPVLMINPADAADRDLANGDHVRIYNDRGGFEGSVVVSTDTIAGVVVSFLGHWSRSPKASSTVNAVTSGKPSNLGRAPTFSDNLVEVAKLPDQLAVAGVNS
jgi:anaerobic selenocysteine-containing dehydrogenase